MDISALMAQNTQTAPESTSRTKLNENFDQFLKLLVTQMQNQDPLEPTKSEDFTNQLVAFSQLEQQISQNEKLDAMTNQFASTQLQSSLNYIGNEVVYPGSGISFEDAPVHLKYRLDSPAAQSQFSIVNANGQIVYSGTTSKNAGAHELVWNGETNDGGTAPPGSYAFFVGAQNEAGEAVNVTSFVSGLVRGIEYIDGRIMLFVNEELVPESHILAVRHPDA